MGEKDGKPKSRLFEDVIYGIAELMFFKKPFSNQGQMSEIDLTKQNPYTIFMGHCQVHLNAMMAQFAKLKRVEFRKSSENKDMVSFYKYKEGNSPTNLDIKDAFSGPYRVTKPMAFGVIEYGKLRVSAVQTTNYLKKEMKKTAVSSAENDQIHLQKRPIEAFCSLFLNNDMNESEDIAQHYALNIELLEVCERADVIEVNLHSLLALDSVEVELKIAAILDHTRADSIFFGSLSGQSNCCATSRTRKISVHAGITLDAPIAELTQFGLKWQRQVRFLIAACPNLECLEFQLSIYFSKKFSPEHIFQHIDAIVKAVKAMLEQLEEGSGQLSVCVDLLASCGFHDYRHYMQILRSLDNSRNADEGNQIFKLGTPFAFDPYAFATGATAAPNATPSYAIARSLTIVDKSAGTAATAGQRAHLFKFKVFERLQTAKKCATHAEAMRIPPLPHPYSPHTDLTQTAKKAVHQGADLDGGEERVAGGQQNGNNNDKHKRNKEKEEEPVDLDSSSDSTTDSGSADEDEEEEDEDEEEQEDNDDDEEDDGDEEEEQKKEEEEQPVAGTSKAAQNDDEERKEEGKEDEEGKEQKEGEEEPGKKRARHI